MLCGVGGGWVQDALRNRDTSGYVLQSLAARVESSSKAVDVLHKRVSEERSGAERAVLEQIHIREQLLRDKEARIEAQANQNQTIMGMHGVRHVRMDG